MLNENRFLGTFRGHNTRTNGLRIVHAAVVDLNCVSVKTFVKFVVRRKMFVNQAEKIASYVGFDILTERRDSYCVVVVLPSCSLVCD